MKKSLLPILLLWVTVCFSQTELAKYQKKSKGLVIQTNLGYINKYYLTVALNNVTKPQPVTTTNTAMLQKRNIFNLTERGQKAFIETIGKLVSNNDKSFLEDLSKNIDKSEDDNSIEVKTTDFVSRFDIKVDNQSGNRNERIDQLEIWVRLDDNDEVEFSGFSNFVNKYKTIDFGTLSVNRVTGFTANAGINLGGTGSTTSTSSSGSQITNLTGTDDYNSSSNQTTNGNNNTTGSSSTNSSNIGIGVSSNKSVSQQISIKSDIVAMKGSLTHNEFSIFQNGAPNQDLDDNLNINVICKALKYSTKSYFIIKGLFDPKTNEAVTNQTKITVKAGYVTCPQITADICGTVSYAFIYRKVLRGENTIRESDDVVSFPFSDDRILTASNPKPVLFKQNELRTKLFSIKSSDGKLMYINYFNKNVPLYFADNVSALQFIEWLRQTNAIKLKSFDIFLSNNGTSFITYSAVSSTSLEPIEKMM